MDKDSKSKFQNMASSLINKASIPNDNKKIKAKDEFISIDFEHFSITVPIQKINSNG